MIGCLGVLLRCLLGDLCLSHWLYHGEMVGKRGQVLAAWCSSGFRLFDGVIPSNLDCFVTMK